ncbi:hypothetical protein [Actinoplanes sp. NPDC049599]|uniref:hypothetical protein n=1 Tax=Actinoplanes sp. NPDC049599 TaxID=3363903 RepID=UPI0037A12FFD
MPTRAGRPSNLFAREVVAPERAGEALLPDGDRLTARRLRFLGNTFGMSDGFAALHWLLDEAWQGGDLSDGSGTR